jgi:hypothetical protein
MERVKEDHDGKIQFQKLGGGSWRLGKRIIKPGEKFFAFPEEIPNSMKDIIVPTSGTIEWTKESKPVVPVYPITKVSYTIEPSVNAVQRGKSNLWWNVVDKDGNILNEKALKKEDAEALVTFNLVSSEGKVLNEKSLTKEDAETLLQALEK